MVDSGASVSATEMHSLTDNAIQPNENRIGGWMSANRPSSPSQQHSASWSPRLFGDFGFKGILRYSCGQIGYEGVRKGSTKLSLPVPKGRAFSSHSSTLTRTRQSFLLWATPSGSCRCIMLVISWLNKAKSTFLFHWQRKTQRKGNHVKYFTAKLLCQLIVVGCNWWTCCVEKSHYCLRHKGLILPNGHVHHPTMFQKVQHYASLLFVLIFTHLFEKFIYLVSFLCLLRSNEAIHATPKLRSVNINKAWR